mmetsp:Transcript_14467/g.36322  ORF Transcript_14467/g.36322 Transcript_14467/m.36322 type:complete len:215 (+) Transcript_14467:1448-2092(+)
MSAVAIGTQTPPVIRSTSTFVPRSNITSASSNTGPNVPATETTMSSNNDFSPVHSPRGPPSSIRPMDIFERIRGIIATRAKMFSTSFPLPSRARPRMQCPIMSCKSFSEGVSNVFSIFSSDDCWSISNRFRSCTLLRIDSVQNERDEIVSDSRRRIRGANFIRNCARSESWSSKLRIEGRLLEDGSLFRTALVAVMAATISLLACSSFTKNNVV